MLDDDEFAQITELYKQGFSSVGLPVNERFLPMRALYESMTGFAESNHLAILHHQISQYGDPCSNCGKPLRTSAAAFCAACGHTVDF